MAWKVQGKGGSAGSLSGAAFVILRVSLGVFMIAKGLDKLAWFVHPNLLAVKPSQSFHVLRTTPDGHVTKLMSCQTTDMYVNGGFFVLRHDIFDHIYPGEELVIEPFGRLAVENKLICHKHDGFWAAMDTFKEKQTLDDLYSSGHAPWELWDGRIAKKKKKGA